MNAKQLAERLGTDIKHIDFTFNSPCKDCKKLGGTTAPCDDCTVIAVVSVKEGA